MHALDIIQEEHRNLWRIAVTIDLVADELADGNVVEVSFFSALIDYIHEFMDGCHHANEDEYLFLAMRRRSAEAATILDRLQEEHRTCPAHLQSLREQLGAGTQALVRNEAFIAGLRAYAQDLKARIRAEEKHAF